MTPQLCLTNTGHCCMLLPNCHRKWSLSSPLPLSWHDLVRLKYHHHHHSASSPTNQPSNPGLESNVIVQLGLWRSISRLSVSPDTMLGFEDDSDIYGLFIIISFCLPLSFQSLAGILAIVKLTCSQRRLKPFIIICIEKHSWSLGIRK